jgi:hypothetical protein
MADLYYAVIALKASEVDQVVAKLKKQALSSISDWLAEAKLTPLYGTRSEDWQPFNGKTIEALIKEGEAGYQSKTNLIDDLDENPNLEGVKTIQIYFIDPCALFLEKYSELARTLDFFVANERECCLVFSQGLTNEQQEQLIGTYCKNLKVVCNEYRGGRPHRIVTREDDLRNFRNSRLKFYGLNRPSQAANQDERLKSDVTRPPSL